MHTDFSNILNHIAVIMDGNGRWAKKRHLPRLFGHRQGVKNVKLVCDLCLKYKVKIISLYAFSTENWKRSDKEVSGLMTIFREFLVKEATNLINKGIRLVVSGRYDQFPADIVEKIEMLMEKSKNNDLLVLNVALNYGSRAEIVDAVKSIINEKISTDKIDEKCIGDHLYNSFMPEPDLLIRTSGEQRISNFMLWQISYSELYFTEKYWPDFNEEEFLKAIEEFKSRARRYGDA